MNSAILGLFGCVRSLGRKGHNGFEFFLVGAIVLFAPFLFGFRVRLLDEVIGMTWWHVQALDVHMLAHRFNRGSLRLRRSYDLLWRLLWRCFDFFSRSSQQMLGLAVKVRFRLDLLTAIAFDPSSEVVILTLTADPASVGKLKVVVDFKLLLFLLLVLGPL